MNPTDFDQSSSSVTNEDFSGSQQDPIPVLPFQGMSYQCCVCPKVFTESSSLLSHRQTHYLKRERVVVAGSQETEDLIIVKQFVCELCQKTFKQKCHLNYHLSHHESVRRFSCMACGRKFKLEETLQAHEAICQGAKPVIEKERPYTCQLCEKSFDSQSHLTGHMITHSNDKQFPCEICSKGFKGKAHVKRHMQTRHPEEWKVISARLKQEYHESHTCEKCHKVFPRVSRLEEHMRTHSGEKPFQCSICLEWFKQKPSMKKHEAKCKGPRTEEECKVNECPMCRKTFDSVSHLNGHMKIHRKDRPFSCVVCYKTFAERSQMRKHIQVKHQQVTEGEGLCSGTDTTQVGSLACHQCFQRFSELSSLEQHFLTHTGSQPFKCASCTLTFKKLHSLKKHELLCKCEKLLELKETSSVPSELPIKFEVLDLDAMEEKI